MYYEFRKMYYHHKGALMILLYFILSLAELLLLDAPVNLDMERNRDAYQYYLQQVEGKCTEETDRLISEEADRIAKANITLDSLYDDYYDGKMTDHEFNTKVMEAQNAIRYEKGFEVIYKQYSDIRENKRNRWFLYTNGWNGLLSHERLNLLFVLLLLLLITPIFCQEYESRMEVLILTEKKGARWDALCKISLVLLTVAVLCLLDSGMRYGFYAMKYGLSHGDYPLQSLTYFAATMRKTSLTEAFLKISAGRLVGSACFAMLIMFIAVNLKKYALTLFTCTTVLLLPHYGFTFPSVKYYLPGPLGFMISTGFFRGSEYRYDAATREKVLIFQEISTTARGLTLTITLGLMFYMAVVILKRNSNVWCERKLRCVNKARCIMLLLCLIILIPSGCSTHAISKEHILYNMEQNHCFENESYRVYMDQSNPEDAILTCEYKPTGEKQRLDRNPMRALTRVLDRIYGYDDFVYYMRIDNDESQFFPMFDRFSIVEIDMHTFSEKLVFERNLNTNRDTFLNIGRKQKQNDELFVHLDAFFLDHSSFYFVNSDKVYRRSRLTRKMDVIIESPRLKSLAFDGKYIYYSNKESQLIQYNTHTGIEKKFFNIVTEAFLFTDTNVVFMNRLDQNRIYAMNRTDGTIRKITEERVLSFSLDNNIIDYTGFADLQGHRIVLN